nr:putative reverse transcriptase domain-containing protein [Tanacetum cinerariifolium]
MLYGRKCRAPICWDQVGERVIKGPEMIEVTNAKVAVAKGKLKEALSPARGVRRFGIKGKLSPRFIGPFEILDLVGEVSYRLALPPQLSHVHDVFHVSLLRGYKYHPLHVITYPLDQIRTDLSYVEEPEAIIDRQDRIMRKKTISFVKILCRNHPEREATWETEESGADEGTGIILRVPDVPTNESDEEISWKLSDEDDDDDVDDQSDAAANDDDQEDEDDDDKYDNNDDQESKNDGDEFIHLKLSIHDEEAKDERDEGLDAEDDDEELYRDVTSIWKSSSVSSQFITSMFNPSSNAGIDSLFESTPRVIVHVMTTVVPLLVTAPTLPTQTIPITQQFAGAVSSIPGIVDRYIDHQMNEAIKVAVQLQSDRLRDEAQAENEDFINKLDENIQKIIKKQVKEQVKVQVSKILLKIKNTVNEQLKADVLTQPSNSSKTSYVVADDLSKMELKEILIEKMESNKSIHRSDEQRNLYKALVDAYECDKIILDTYGDTVSLKRRRDDADKDEEPSVGSDRVSKRKREGKEPESTSAPKDKASKTTGKSTKGSKSHQKTASESTPAEDPIQATQDLEEPSHQEFETDTMNLVLLAGPTYELMKGSCKSLVDLKFFLEEVYKATTNQLD